MKSFVIFRHVPIPKFLGFGILVQFWVLGQFWVWVIWVLGQFWVWRFGVLGSFRFGFGFRFFPQIMILINKKNTIAC
jgi:hypothetical protein